MSFLGLDIGGANLKAADIHGRAASRPFPMWTDFRRLTAALGELIDQFPGTTALAVTMTGELADCFATKADGVAHIVRSVAAAGQGRPTWFYQTHGGWADAAAALAEPRSTAAANWHALTMFVGRRWIGRPAAAAAMRSAAPIGPLDDNADRSAPALLIDIGSTTTDIIPLTAGLPAARGTTDLERLLAGELVYTGVARSPVCGVVSKVPWRGQDCPVALELFATMLDVYLTLGQIAEDPGATQTADGRPATIEAAHDRLARMVCADRTECSATDARAIAEAVAARQRQLIVAKLRALATAPATIAISGQGEFLARSAAAAAFPAARIVALSEALGAQLSGVATAYALASLAEEDEP